MKQYVFAAVAASCMLVGCNRSIESASQKYNELPKEVQATVRAQAPNGEIAQVSQKHDNGLTLYQIEFREPGKNPKMLVTADGRVVNNDMSAKGAPGPLERLTAGRGAVGTKFSALPEKVQKTFKARAPEGEIADIARHENDGRVVYEFEFKDQGKNPTMRIADDGTVVQELQK